MEVGEEQWSPSSSKSESANLCVTANTTPVKITPWFSWTSKKNRKRFLTMTRFIYMEIVMANIVKFFGCSSSKRDFSNWRKI